jgi:ribosomal protein S18 acetylase RimI-like enzyme
MTDAAIAIRAARLEDAPAIAALHVAVSRVTYRDLAPPETLQRLDLAHRQARWTAMLQEGARVVLLAERGDRLVGIGSAGPASVPVLGDHAEVLHLYVDPGQARRGIGRTLMRHLARALQAQGFRSVALGVVEGNQAALEFYLKLGGQLAGSYTDPGPLWRSQNRVVIWDDLQTLL